VAAYVTDPELYIENINLPPRSRGLRWTTTPPRSLTGDLDAHMKYAAASVAQTGMHRNCDGGWIGGRYGDGGSPADGQFDDAACAAPLPPLHHRSEHVWHVVKTARRWGAPLQRR
jgi:hypothetical protein